ncbi:MAG: sulfatase-like hydrolase/transferase [Elusimicrobiota bacterium]
MKPPTHILFAAVLAAGAALAACTLFPPNRGVHVVLITIDTLRADHLPMYGYDKVETPHLDALLKDSVLFENAASHAPITLPSHASIMTGLYPMGHGVRNNGNFYASDSLHTMAEILKDNGYRTGAFVGSFVLDSRFGLDQGFEVYDDDMIDGRAKASPFMFKDRTAGTTLPRIFSWLQDYQREKSRGPLFLWTHFYDPHREYTPPEPFASRYRAQPYDGEIAYTDSQIGLLLDALKGRGLYDDALIIVTADHGESLGEHGETTHSVFIYEATQHVPLLIKFPHSKYAGAKVAELVRHVDLLPTVLDVVRVRSVPKIVRAGLPGVSLLPRAAGKAPKLELASYAEAYLPKHHFGWSALESLREGSLKYIQAPRPELYDLAQDPQELDNLAEKKPKIARRFRLRLKELKEAQVSAAAGGAAAREMDRETIEKLKSLGYISAGPVSASDAGKDPKDMIRLHERIKKVHHLVTAKKHEEAVVKLQAILKENPENLTGRTVLAGSYIALGRFDDAIREYQEIRRRDPKFLLSYLALARIYTKKRVDFKAAERELKGAAMIAPDDPVLWILRGDLLQEQKKISESIAAYHKAEALGEQSADLFVGLGSAFNKQNQTDKALATLTMGLKADPKSAEAYYNLGVVLERKGDYARAEQSYLSALKHKLEDPLSLGNLGSLYHRQKRYQDSIAVLRRAIASDPDAFVALYNLGSVHLDRGRPKDAVPFLEKAVRLRKDFAFARNNLALAYSRLGRRENAFKQYRALTTITAPKTPDHAGAWLRMAQIRARQDRLEEAKQYLRAALENGGAGLKQAVQRDPQLSKLTL